MDKKIATSFEKRAALQAITVEFKGNTAAMQRTRLMEAFTCGWAITTYEAMRYLDIYFPPARVKELRDRGERIKTHWVSAITESGQRHLIGMYVRESGVNHDAV